MVEKVNRDIQSKRERETLVPIADILGVVCFV